jgi:phage terminase large subunit-like protein
MLDARQEGGSYRRIEVITGQRRRRQWTAEEKARIVAESFEKGANKAVHASRGKAVRAEPIAALYEQRRVHHVGTFPLLEDQMSAFSSDFDRGRAGYSPDHVDALVWALTSAGQKDHSAVLR